MKEVKRISLIIALNIVLLLTGCGNTKDINSVQDNKEELTLVNNEEQTDIILESVEVEDNTYENIDEEPVIQDEAPVIQDEEPVVLPPEPEYFKVDMLMVGDSLIHSGVYKAAKQSDGTYNFNEMFEYTKKDIDEADIAIINQETIFIEDKNLMSSYPMFGSPTEVGDAEALAGFDVIAHSTNHTIDKKLTGINDTINFWETNYPDITYLGIHNTTEESDVKYLERNNIKFAFVNYTYGLNGLEPWREGNEYMIDMLTDYDIEDTLAEAEENADLTIAILHVGTEYVYKPTDYQQEQVDRFIDNGADIVFCAHPHVVQPYEMRETAQGNKGLVYYSLGNYISSQDEIPRIIGGMAKVTIEKKVEELEETVYIKQYSMEPLVTHQESGYYTTYKLEDYTDELCKRHKLQSKKNFDCEYLWNFYRGIIENKEE